jgi:16S rRNA (cytosine1402-N4)-methyltransferase
MHQPVLYQEIIHALRPRDSGFYIDGTVGAGGHAKGILQASSPSGKLLGFDLDPQALDMAGEHLAHFGERVILVQATYLSLKEQLISLNWPAVDGIVLDLGLSSLQLDAPNRGFSFRLDGPLDMRFDPLSEVQAADLVNELPERELADMIYRYSEERRSREIARAIVKARPINTTLQLADLVVKVMPQGRSRVHPATRTFQALRIATNDELESVRKVLPQAADVLTSGGRLAVISFHSLEDRLVKQYFRQESSNCICPPEQPVCNCDHRALFKLVTRKPIRPKQSEIDANPRARSARLRVVEKV